MPSSQDDSTDCERQTEDIRRALSPVAPTAPPRPGLEWVRPCYGWALAALVAVIVISGWTRIALTQNATVTLNSTADATVKQGTPNSNQGAETLLRIQQSGSNRALVRFDQQALEQAIGSASVRSAKLRLFVVANGNNWGSEGREVNVHRLTQPWTELGATWNCPNDTNTSNSSPDCNPGWEMGGRSLPPFAVAPTQVILHQNGQTGWVEWDVTADVRKFLDQEWSNYGWIVRKDDEGAAGQVDYASREGTNTPRLVVELGEPPQPPAAGGLTAVSDADVRSGSPNQNQGNRMRLQVQSSGNNRVLVQFDRQAMLATVGNGALQNAKLRLYVISNANNWGSSGRIVNVHRIAQAWTEQGSTWNCPNDLNPFNSQADCTPTWNMSNSAQWPFVGTATGSLVQQNNQTGWVEWDVTGDVAQILGGSVPNYGWLIRKDNESQTGQVEYGSRESPHKPELRLTVQANNQAPQVSAGTDQTITLPGTASLAGSASDDGLPSGSALTYQWSQTGGPGTASFNNPASAATVVSFDVPGTYVLRLTVSDSQLTGTDEMTVVVNPPPPVNQAPQVSAGPDQTITLPATATLTGSASDDGLPAGSMLVVSWSKVSGPGTASFDNSGSRVTAVTFSAAGTYQLRLTATDSALSTSDDVSVTVNPGGPVLPPDPVSVAPPLDRTVVTTVFKASEFLYSGTNPIQTGVAPGTITPIRAAVLRGRVITREGQPLSGVRISVSSHPELGQTLSRGDGMFDLAVNGGGLLTVGYEKAGLLPVHRQVNVPWQDYRSLPSVALVPLDAQVSTVAAGAAAIQVHQANVVTDSDGSRRATLLFPAGTTATMELPGGGAQPLNTMQVRATEYTVGPNGPLAMPATLPANSFYTYCVELSVDEAIAANAHSVRFSQPVVKYVDNFLGVAVGTIVPEGYYDRQKAQWVASTSGRVVQILSVVDSQAILDVDGSGSAATPEAMAALGITGTERLKLAELYAPGQSLWRVPIDHFTTWDSNWGVQPPNDAAAANQNLRNDNQTDCHDTKTGSVIECQNQVLGENLGLTGVRFGLHYNSDRAPGRLAARTLEIPLSGSAVPASLKRIRLEVAVAGKRFEQEYPAAVNQRATFTWDGQDAYGRILQGRQPVRVAIGYIYDAVYGVTSRFGYNGNGNRISGLLGGGGGGGGTVRARIELTFWQELSAAIGVWEPEAAGLGGWTFSVHHGYDPVGKTLYQGSGERRRAEDLNTRVATAVAGNRSLGLGGDGGPATQSPMDPPFGLAFAPDGSLYITDVNYSRIRRVSPTGIITTVAGIASGGFSGDGGPATAARLNSPKGVAVGADGSIYIADTNNHRIRRVGLDGIITTVAGTGVPGFNGDGSLATLAQLNFPHGLAMGPDGSFYIADKQNHRIRRIEPGGTISTVAGNGVAGYDGHGIPATQTRLKAPEAVAVRPDGALYIADTDNHFVRLVTTSGIIWPVVGTGPSGPPSDGEGGPASATAVSFPNALAIDTNGGYFVTSGHRVRYVDTQGRIYTAAGKTDAGNSNDGDPAGETLFNGPSGLAIGPEGNLYISDTYSYRVRKVVRPLPDQAFTDVVVASGDGSQLYHFNAEGKHLRTLNGLTGSVLYQFGYNGQGLLTTVTDADGDVTTVQRDSAGNPAAIVGPFGQRTTLTVDSSGYLAGVTSPNNEAVQLSSSPTGLLLAMRDPKSQEYRFQYDSQGRLTRDEDPAGGFQTLTRTELQPPPVGATSGYEVTHQTALGQQTRYQVNQLGSGAEQLKNFLPDGTQTTSTIGISGNTTLLDTAGNQTSLQFAGDPRWGLQAPFTKSLTVTTPGGLSSTVLSNRTATLSDPGNPLSLITQTDTSTVNGRTYANVFNAGTRTFTGTSPLGRQSTTTIDNLGRVVQSRLASLNPVSFAYDARGRVQSISQGSGAETRISVFGYNTLGYLETITDPLNRVTSFQYNDAGRVTQQTLPGNRVISFTYDANGNLMSLTPPGKPQHAFDYTEVDLMKEYDPPAAANVGARVTTYSYDSERKPTLFMRPDAQTVDFGYDTAARFTTVNLPGRQLTYGYHTTTGNLASITDSSGSSLAYTYDGSLPKSSTWTGPVAGSVAWSYDNNFRVTSHSLNGSNTIHFGYDNDSLLTQAGALTLSRNPQNGLLTGTTLGTVSDSWTYNNFAEPTGYAASVAGTPVYSTTFTRDKLGRIASKTDTIQGVTDNYAYGYDTAGRLETVTKNASLISQYTYDANGNRLSAQRFTNPEPLTTYTYDAQDRLVTQNSAVSTQSFTYSANGELQSKTNGSQATSYQYDVIGNLRHVTLPDGTQIDYIIDAQDRRVGKKVNGVLVQAWLYGNQLNPIAELDGSNQIISTFIYGSRANAPDYLIKNGITYRIVSDHLGSPRLVINTATGAVAQRLDYDEFGNIVQDTSPGFQPFGFAGGLYDNQTKLTRFGARDYDAESGRWTAKDPIGFEGGDANVYRYVLSDPVNLIDSSGLSFLQDTRPKPPDWFPDWLKSFFAPDALDLSPTPLTMAAGKACKLVPRAAKKLAPVILGESMKRRTIPYAEKVGGHYWKPRGFEKLAEKNERWLKEMIRQGREIIDLGIDTSRAVRSKFYQLEREILDNLGYPTTKP